MIDTKEFAAWDKPALAKEIERLQAENAHLNAEVKSAKAIWAALDDNGPGTPLGRLKGIASYAISAGLCTGVEGKAAEVFLIENHAKLKAALERIANDRHSSWIDLTEAARAALK